MNGCIVCGSTATVLRFIHNDTIPLCVAHEYVCADHLEDPCSICDTQ